MSLDWVKEINIEAENLRKSIIEYSSTLDSEDIKTSLENIFEHCNNICIHYLKYDSAKNLQDKFSKSGYQNILKDLKRLEFNQDVDTIGSYIEYLEEKIKEIK